MSEKERMSDSGIEVDAETGEVLYGKPERMSESSETGGSGLPNGAKKPNRGGKKKKIIAIICSLAAILATLATFLGIFLRKRAGEETSPAIFTLEFFGLEEPVILSGEEGAPYLAPDTARDGYEFEGWYTGEDFSTAAELPAAIPAENMRFYARYEKLYTVSFWDGELLMAQITGKAGTEISAPENKKDGFLFEGWYTDADFAELAEVPQAVPAGGGDYFAKFAELFTVIYMEGETELCRATGKLGTELVFSAPQREGYEFERWVDGTGEPVTPETIVGNAVYYAQYARLYTVSFYDGEAVLYTVTGKAGASVSVPEASKDGYRFGGWTDGESEPVVPSEVIVGDANYYAVYEKLYTVRFYNGEEELQSATLAAGEEVAAPDAPSKVGYTFLGWYAEEDETHEPLDFPLPAEARNMVYLALFGENPKLYFHANAPLGAEASGEMQAREGVYGVQNSFAVIGGFSVLGYEFAGWAESGDGRVLYADGEEVFFTENKDLYAQWARAYSREAETAIIYDTERADGYPVYVSGNDRIVGERSVSPLGDSEYEFSVAGEVLRGRLNADGTYEPCGAERDWYALPNGKAFLGGYGEALFACDGENERGEYRFEMAQLLYYEGEACTGTYRIEFDAREMRLVDNRSAYGSYYGEQMLALVLGAQAEFGGMKGVYIAAGETVYFYFNGVETQGTLTDGTIEYGGNVYERLEGELCLYGDAGEELRFTPNGSVYESEATWLSGGETLSGTVVSDGSRLLFRGGDEDFVYEWELNIALNERRVGIGNRRERIRYLNRDEFLEYQAGERDEYGILWRIRDGEKDVIEGNAFITAEGVPFFVTLAPRTAADEHTGSLNGIDYVYRCTFSDGSFVCNWFGLRSRALADGDFLYEVTEFAGGRGYAQYADNAVRERLSVRFSEKGAEIAPQFLFLRGETEVSLIEEGAHAGRYELSFTRDEFGYLTGIKTAKYTNLRVGNGLLAMDGEREVSFLFYEDGWREAEVARGEDRGYPLLFSDGRIFLREGDTVSECAYKTFEDVETLVAGSRVLYVEVTTEGGAQDAVERDGAWYAEETLYTLRIAFTGSGTQMQITKEKIEKRFCAVGERYHERTEIYYTMSAVGVLGRVLGVTSGGREQELLGELATERGTIVHVAENGIRADWLFNAGVDAAEPLGRQEETLGELAIFTILYSDGWYTVSPEVSFLWGEIWVAGEGELSHTGDEWVWSSAGEPYAGLTVTLFFTRGAFEENPFTVRAEGLPKTLTTDGAKAICYSVAGEMRVTGLFVADTEYGDAVQPLAGVYYFAEAGYLAFPEEERLEAVEERSATDGDFTVTYAELSDTEKLPLSLSKGGEALAGSFTAGDAFVFHGTEVYSVVWTQDGVQVFEGTPKLFVLVFVTEEEELVRYAPAGDYRLPNPTTREGYKFTGWQTPIGERFSGTYTVTENMRFTATWEPCVTVKVYESLDKAISGEALAVLEVKKNGNTNWVYLEEDLEELGLTPQRDGSWYWAYCDPDTGEITLDFPFEGEFYDDYNMLVLDWE